MDVLRGRAGMGVISVPVQVSMKDLWADMTTFAVSSNLYIAGDGSSRQLLKLIRYFQRSIFRRVGL